MSAPDFGQAIAHAVEVERLVVNLMAVTGLTFDEAVEAGRASTVTGGSMTDGLSRLYDQACRGGKS